MRSSGDITDGKDIVNIGSLPFVGWNITTLVHLDASGLRIEFFTEWSSANCPNDLIIGAQLIAIVFRHDCYLIADFLQALNFGVVNNLQPVIVHDLRQGRRQNIVKFPKKVFLSND